MELEDIHMHIEQALIDRLGDVGRKLHTARSRNDQVSTALRLWVRDAIDRVDQRLVALQRAFVGRCERDADVILPAIPTCSGPSPSWRRTTGWPIARSSSATGSGWPTAAAARMPARWARRRWPAVPADRPGGRRPAAGLRDVAANSLDASSDRDFVLESLFVLSLIAEHLSTWAEEWILWSTAEFSFLKLPQAFCTGSSIMPQKINPDVLELIRGKTARVVGNLQTLLVLVKGLPLAYNRDLQEDKPPLFDAFDTVEACLELAAPLVRGAELNRPAIQSRLDRGHLDATTLMEHFIRRGVAQRRAHHFVGQLVGKAMEQGVRLADLPLAEFQQLDPTLDASVYDVLGVENAVAAFVSYGSTAPQQVAQQVQRWKQQLS